MKYFVEIVNYETGEVVKRMDGGTERRAEKIDRGANINLDHENYFTRIVEEKEPNHVLD